MLSSENGAQWKGAKVRTALSRPSFHLLKRSRLLYLLLTMCLVLFTWRPLTSKAGDLERFYCWGPPKSPLDMSPLEVANWQAHLQTPVIYNHHHPVKLSAATIERVNLNRRRVLPDSAIIQEPILLLSPLKDAAPFLNKYFDLISQLTYPHHLIDLAFIVGDSRDDTLAVLARELDRIQSNPGLAFRSATIVEKDMGYELLQDVETRHGFAAQGPRRKMLGRVRNFLLSAALKPEHAWVYWRDVDIQDSPASIIEDFIAHDRDILVPNIWFHRYEKQDGILQDIEGRFDYNSWAESPEGLALASSLDKNTVLAEGYKEYATNRQHMAKIGDWRDNKDEEMELDGIGGVNILVRADVHRAGINFPSYSFENQAETEGFAKMAKRAGYGVYGLPNYVVWHIDTKEKPGNG